MKTYIVETEIVETVRKRAEVVVQTESDILDKDVDFELKWKADRILESDPDISWKEVPGSRTRSFPKSYSFRRVPNIKTKFWEKICET